MRISRWLLATMIAVNSATLTLAGAQSGSSAGRPKGPCDIYTAAGDACVAAHSTTRALYAAYNGPLYQVMRQSDGKTLDIGVVAPAAIDPGGYADAAAQDVFCAQTQCWITVVYDQAPKHNDLSQAPRGGFSGPAMGGFNNLPIADMAPITIMGHKAYGVFIAPGMGLRQNDAKGTAVDDQAEGTYWVINGLHYNAGCCFDYGNSEIDSRDDNNGTMETTYYGDSTPWYHGNPPGPWVMTDQENNLVGCVNPDGSKLCANLPNITWRFVTAMAKGEPHHWTSLGGDAQRGTLSVMFDGPRVDASYDPMRKQGAILLGNGGDNSNSSQGTFYEGAMTAAGTFPADATDQAVQANVVAAGYGLPAVRIAPASAAATPPGLQTFSPGSSQETTVTFTNTAATPVSAIKLELTLPDPSWKAVVAGTGDTAKQFSGPLAPGASVSANFTVTSGPKTLNGDLTGGASWIDAKSGSHSENAVEKLRNVSPVKINEFRAGTTSPEDSTNSFIELYNAGKGEIDLSNWTLTEHPTQQAVFSVITIPAGKKLAAGGFYLLGLSNSGLAVAGRTGDNTLHLRNKTGMAVGDAIEVGTGSDLETRTIAKLGSAASESTTVWQPVPDGPVIKVTAGSTNVPVASTDGFVVGEKIALGYGASYPPVARTLERFEVATVTAVGKPGTQAYLAADAKAGSTNIQVTSAANISVGDTIRLDIESVGHGVETVTVAKVGTESKRTTLAAQAAAGATNIRVHSVKGFALGDEVLLGSPTSQKTYTITAIGTARRDGTGMDVKPAFAEAHAEGEDVVKAGTGLDLVAPLKFNHAFNLPFSDRGTGITFEPATAFVHSSNEPVQALGTGLTLDRPLGKDHAMEAAVRDARVKTAGYQDSAMPDQWFGGPTLFAEGVMFGDHPRPVTAGSIVLRDGAGLVVDSVNYGLLVDPWASEGYQSTAGPEERGCPAPVSSASANTSTGRVSDGLDKDSNCTDFEVQPATPGAPARGSGESI